MSKLNRVEELLLVGLYKEPIDGKKGETLRMRIALETSKLYYLQKVHLLRTVFMREELFKVYPLITDPAMATTAMNYKTKYKALMIVTNKGENELKAKRMLVDYFSKGIANMPENVVQYPATPSEAYEKKD